MREQKMNGGWIEWKGGECPIKSDKTRVDVKFKDGEIAGPGYKINWLWTWIYGGRGGDIIAYRITENHEPTETAPIDMSQNRVPWGLLTDAEKAAIEGHNGPREFYAFRRAKWCSIETLGGCDDIVFRTVAQPVITSATYDRCVNGHRCFITLVYHDGKPISGTVAV